jgi:HK97 family phage portal protein
MTDRTLGVPNLVSARSQQLSIVQRDTPGPSGLRSFFAPIFSFFPFSTGHRTFTLWPGGGQALGPVNLSRSYGNIRITPELSLTLSAVWACVWRYANTVSSLPFELMQGEERSARQAIEHPLYQILRYKPNTQMSAAKFWQSMTASMMTWGVAYARKLTIGKRVVGLKPLRPEFMTAYLDDQERLRYRYWPSGLMSDKGNTDFSADELLVIIDRSMDGYTGLSRIQYAANSMGLAMAGDRAASLSFKNGLRASGILTIAQWLKPEQRAAYKKIVNDFVGTGTGEDTDKQFGVMVAENATKFEALSLKPVDMEMLSSRKFSTEEICRWYDTPPILIGHATEGQTMWGSGVEQIVLGWMKLGLGPVLTTIAQEVRRQCLTPEEQAEGYFAAHDIDSLLDGDSQARAAFYASLGQNGIMSRNEMRRREYLPPVDGGDSLTVQSNLIPIDKLGQTPDNTVQVRDALRAFLGIKDEPERGDPK